MASNTFQFKVALFSQHCSVGARWVITCGPAKGLNLAHCRVWKFTVILCVVMPTLTTQEWKCVESISKCRPTVWIIYISRHCYLIRTTCDLFSVSIVMWCFSFVIDNPENWSEICSVNFSCVARGLSFFPLKPRLWWRSRCPFLTHKKRKIWRGVSLKYRLLCGITGLDPEIKLGCMWPTNHNEVVSYLHNNADKQTYNYRWEPLPD